MKNVLIKNVGKVITGNTPSKSKEEFYASADIGFVKPDIINDSGISFIKEGSEYISENARAIARIVGKESIFVTCIGSIGKIGIALCDLAFNQQINAIVPNERVIPKYLAYCLCHNKSRLVHMANAPVVPIINKTQFENFSISICENVEEQKRIVRILDIVSEIISKRQQEMVKLDDLIKSRFVEMFGDPVSNPKKWKIVKVIDVCDCMVPGRDKPRSFTGSIPWITIDDLIINGVTIESKKNLGLTKNEISEVKRKVIPVNSVIMSCVGNLGLCSIAGKELIMNQQLHSFQCKKDISEYYLMFYLGYRTDYMSKFASSTTVSYMNKTICNSIPVMLPPVILQNQFADFVQQVDKSKLLYKSPWIKHKNYSIA